MGIVMPPVSAASIFPSAAHSISVTALNNTALWTPAAGKRFRLMAFKLIVEGSTAAAAASDLFIDLRDGNVSLGLTHVVWIPAASAAARPNDTLDLGWVTLGSGLLSAAVNNVLNINLSVALTTGRVQAIAVGSEE